MATVFHGYQSLVENSPDAIYPINENGKILHGSASITNLLGYTPDEQAGKDRLELFHLEDLVHPSFLLKEAMGRPPNRFSWSARVRTKAGEYRWVESTVSNRMMTSRRRPL